MVKYGDECIEIKEQLSSNIDLKYVLIPDLYMFYRMYQYKLSALHEQLAQLDDCIHPEYMKRLKRLEQMYQDRIHLNEVFLNFEVFIILISINIHSIPFPSSRTGSNGNTSMKNDLRSGNSRNEK